MDIEENQKNCYKTKITDCFYRDQPFIAYKVIIQKNINEKLDDDDLVNLGIDDMARWNSTKLRIEAILTLNILQDLFIEYISNATAIYSSEQNQAIKLHKISKEYKRKLKKYIDKNGYKPKNIPYIRCLQSQHIDFIRELMVAKETCHKSIDLKLRLLKDEYPNLQVSRSTVHTVINKILNYSYKRVTQIRPKASFSKKNNQKRLVFIKKYLQLINNPRKVCIVIDEVGFNRGTYRNYGYSKKGEPCIILTGKKQQPNSTMITAISKFRVEQVQFVYPKGAKTEIFAKFIGTLVQITKQRYPSKSIVFLMDNYCAHKTSQVYREVQDNQISILYLPPYSPEFSAIEQLFKTLKQKLVDLEFDDNIKVMKKVLQDVFEITQQNLKGYFRFTIQNVKNFYLSQNWVELFN